MVQIRKMRQDEFKAYYNYFIEDYSQEIAENYGSPVNEAIEHAKKELNQSFPHGIDDDNDLLFCIDTEINGTAILIGYLWYSINIASNSAFIYDFYIKEEFRSQGYGKLTIIALEKRLSTIGIPEIKLRVAFKNKRALKLYDEVGFKITGYNMSKCIG